MHWRQFGKTSKARHRILGEICSCRLAVDIKNCMLTISHSYGVKGSSIFLGLVVNMIIILCFELQKSG